MKASDFEIDCELVPFDTKRVVLEDVETVISEKTGEVMLKRLARISRGIFQLTNISSKWLASGEKWSIQQARMLKPLEIRLRVLSRMLIDT